MKDSTRRSHNHLHDVEAVRVAAREDGRADGEGQRRHQRGRLLRQPLHAARLASVAGRTHHVLEVVLDGEAHRSARLAALYQQLVGICAGNRRGHDFADF